KSRKLVSDDNSSVIKPEKSFAGLKKSEIFVTGGFDVPFFALVIVILAVGLVMLFSASYPYAYFKYGNSYHFFLRQFIFAVSGIVIMLIVSKLNFKIYKALSPVLLGVTLFLLVLVLFYHTKVATDEGEAFKRYIKVPGIGQFQPSDIAKFTLITTLASYISLYAKKMHTFKYGVMYPAIIIGVYCILIMLENHLSGTIIVGVIGLSLMFAGGSNRKLFIAGLSLLVAVVIVVWMFPQILPEYVQQKLEAFTNKDFEPLGSRWQTNNSLYAIGSGGLFGAGLGNSKQKYLYVSEPQNDFIFSIVCEELGFVGAIAIILLFVALVVRGFIIALRINDKFASLTVIGIITQVGVQVAFNILVVTDSIPNTGIALPFFSYGGTALLMLLFEMGVVLAISRKSNQKKIQSE
ncbi:MAG: putative lipid II flippase FtsW, partial [Clostridiales bacterium]|nr:putative lipid II flippase FtsW [Clostridiales bacterium]